jgi:hypothetical protein
MSLNNVIPLEMFNQPNVWAPAKASEEPEVILHYWQIYECKIDHYDRREKHLVGHNGRSGRVTSKVAKVELVNGEIHATTGSGRVYKLAGEPGRDRDAMYTWVQWLRMHNAQDVICKTTDYYDYDNNAQRIPATVD